MQNNLSILVTGATGLVGQAVVSELLAKTDKIIRIQVRDKEKAYSLFSQFVNQERMEIIESDFTSASDRCFSDLVSNCSTIVHLAGLVHKPDADASEYERLNVEATDKLISTACASKTVDTFLFLSSSAVYGNGPFFYINEDEPVNPQTPYAMSKLKCEELLTNSNIARIIILRPSMIFGEGDRGNLIKLIKTISKKKYIQIGKGETAKSLIYSRDLATVILDSLSKLAPGKHVFNAANPQAISMKNLSSEIWYALGYDDKITSVPKRLLFAGVKLADKILPGRLPVNEEQLVKLTTETTLSTHKLETMIDFKPNYTVPAALRAEIKWAKNNQLI